jgi:soluble lytic murein transglycosylase-like protein
MLRQLLLPGLLLIGASTTHAQIVAVREHGEVVYVQDDRYSHLSPDRAGSRRKTARRHPPPALATLADAAARQYRLDPRLLEALIAIESGWETMAVSRRGASGLMQLMPQTAAQYGARRPLDPQENLLAGARYLQDLIARYHGDLERALAAYYAGPATIDRLPVPIADTAFSHYVRNVLDSYFAADDGRGQSRAAPIFAVADERGQLWYTNQ